VIRFTLKVEVEAGKLICFRYFRADKKKR